jgi:hypothetical protein
MNTHDLIQKPGIGYWSTAPAFLETDVQTITGALSNSAASRMSTGSTEHAQILAWSESIGWLKSSLAPLVSSENDSSNWVICLEYEIPRRTGRIDCVLIARGVVFVIEFKHDKADQLARLQVEDYGMELMTFHLETRHFSIVPILCTGNAFEDHHEISTYENGHVSQVSITNPNSLSTTISAFLSGSQRRTSLEDGTTWIQSPYEPIPTIVEAATTLFAGHGVEDISRTDSSIEDLNRVRRSLESVARVSVESGSKIICFVTGVPGAGKTLAGLSIAHSEQFDRATFLSGNGPLVKVLSESLKRDLMLRTSVKAEDAKREATTFISNVHVC